MGTVKKVEAILGERSVVGGRLNLWNLEELHHPHPKPVLYPHDTISFLF
jgi:hypothetical protein